MPEAEKQISPDGLPNAAPETPIKPGMVLSGRYQIEKELGRGRIGVVFLARDLQLLSRPVVVKVLLEKSYQDPWIKKKFLQEMEALVRTEHPGVVTVYDAGEISGGMPYLVMQYIEGTALRQILDQPIALSRVGRLVTRVAQALGAAHDRGVLHRDLKPENIMLQTSTPGQEDIKLIDFGLAKIRDSKIGDSSVIPNVAGSFGYMSPEQLLSKPVGTESDIYALGVIVYEMITGRRPYQPQSVFELYEMQKREDYPSLREVCPTIPAPAEQLIRSALSFDPKNRPSSAREFGNQLSRALGSSAPTEIHSFVGERPITQGTTEVQTTFFPLPYLFVLSSILSLIAFGIALKVCFYRFQSWISFASQPVAILALAAATFLLLFWVRRVTLMQPEKRRLFPGASLILLTLLGVAAFTTHAVVDIHSISGPLQPKPESFTMNYSDPKGYKYTLVQTKYSSIRVDPGRFNSLKNYEIRITLSPDLEFSEVYLDQKFHLSDPLLLQPSNTNDILLVKKKDDSFRDPRIILFSYKYRTLPRNHSVTVSVDSEGQQFSYEAEIEL